VRTARERLRAKLSYTNIGYALAPNTFTISELRQLYVAALGHDVTATNLRRVLLRRGVLSPTSHQRDPGSVGGPPAALFRFRDPHTYGHGPVRGPPDRSQHRQPSRPAGRQRRRALAGEKNE
jgi:hypothetical protein